MLPTRSTTKKGCTDEGVIRCALAPLLHLLDWRIEAMPQACTICRHAKTAEIDQMLIEGTSLRNIAKRFGTSTTALHRHKQHLAPALAVAKEAAQEADAGTLLDKVKQLLVDAQRLTAQAEQAKQLDVALRGIREVRGVLELLGKVSSELATREAAAATITDDAREKLRAKLLGSPWTQQEARKRIQALCDEYGLALIPVKTGDYEDNELRIAELLAKAGSQVN